MDIVEQALAEIPKFDSWTDESLYFAKKKADQYNSTYGKKDEDGYYCQLCRNKGYIANYDLEGDTYRVSMSQCTCWNKREALKALLGDRTIQPDKTFSNFKVHDTIDQMMLDSGQRFAAKPQGFLYIGGQVGSGKTHIAMATVNSLVDSGHKVKIMYWNDDVMEIKTNRDAIKFYQFADVLYIDDLYRRRVNGDISESDRDIAFSIINVRYVNKRPTIITSEMTLTKLLGIDQAVGSRIAEDSTNIAIKEGIARNRRI